MCYIIHLIHVGRENVVTAIKESPSVVFLDGDAVTHDDCPIRPEDCSFCAVTKRFFVPTTDGRSIEFSIRSHNFLGHAFTFYPTEEARIEGEAYARSRLIDGKDCRLYLQCKTYGVGELAWKKGDVFHLQPAKGYRAALRRYWHRKFRQQPVQMKG